MIKVGQILIFSFVFFALLFFLFNFSLAQEPECNLANVGQTKPCGDCGTQACHCIGTDCSWTPCSGTYTEEDCCNANGYFESTSHVCNTQSKNQYRCAGTNCGTTIQKRVGTKNQYCSGNSALCDGEWDTYWTYGSATSFTNCKSWQKCEDTGWSDSLPSCQCVGECLEAPENLKTFDGLGEVSPNNVKLPVKLAWNNVPGAAFYYYEVGKIESFTQGFENGYSNYGKNSESNLLIFRLSTSSPGERIELNHGYIEEGATPELYNSEYTIPGYGWNFTNASASIIYWVIGGLEAHANSSINFYTQKQNQIKEGVYIIQCEKAWMVVVPEIPGMPYTEDWAIGYCGWVHGGSGKFIKFWTVEEIEVLKEPYYKAKEDVIAIKDFVPAPPPESIPTSPVPSEPVSSWKGFVDKPEITFPSCLIESNAAYTWKVRACCSSNKEACGPWSDLKSFSTNAAPEPISPADPDWNGPEKIGGLAREEIEKLKWCEINDQNLYKKTILGGENYYCPLSYKILIYYSEKDLCHPNLWDKGRCNEFILTAKEGEGELFPPFEFWDENHTFFTRSVPYAWKVAACKDTGAVECSDYSQLWRFEGAFTLEKPIPISPKNDKETPIGLPVLIEWSSPYAHSFRYKVNDESGNIITSGRIGEFNLSLDSPLLSLDTIYSWRVQPCWDYEGNDCENIWSDVSWFRTTGRPPKLESMKPVGADIPIPVAFEWEAVPGAKSYIFKIWGDNLNKEIPVGQEAKVSLYYPDLHQETNYSWKVKTCARENGELCGEWGASETFTTFKLVAPENPSPEDGAEIFTYQMPKNLSWDSDAKYFKYTLNYVTKSPEEKGDCPTGQIIEKIVSNASDFVSLTCLGDYQWQVVACLDENCQEKGEESDVWSFTLSQKAPPGKGGLVPCGRTYDDPNTPWNEREPCQIKHLFLLLRNVIDFLLWKLGLMVLVLLIIISGVIYYFSMGSPVTVINVRKIWEAAGIGYGIMILAWTIVNLLLALSGYQIGIFGRWWQIIF